MPVFLILRGGIFIILFLYLRFLHHKIQVCIHD